MSRSGSKKSPFQIYLFPILAIIGVGVSTSLTQHFYDLRAGTAGFKSYCNISDKMNCDVIAASPYAELVAGIPLSSFATGWFLALFFVSFLAFNAFWRREALRAILGMSFFGTFLGAFYFVLMIGKLNTYCLLCLAVDILNILTLVSVLTLKPEGFSQHKLDLSKWKTLSGIIATSLIVSILVLKTMEGMSLSERDIEDLTNRVLGVPPVSVSTQANFPAMGPTDAKITVVEFSDFQCPFCRFGAFYLNAVMNRFPKDVRVIFRHYPLDQSCNPEITQTLHPIACEAARMAICAGQQGHFDLAYQNLFEGQGSFVPGRPLEIAKSMGLAAEQIQSCMASPDTASVITRDIQDGKILGVKSTPTFFINGYKMEGAFPVAVWNRIIERLLTENK